MTTPPQPLPTAATELGHATRVMAAHPDLRYANGLGWFRWDGVRWASGAEADLTAAVHAAAARYAALSPGAFASSLASRQGLSDVALICRDVPGVSVRPEDLDQCSGRLHTAGITWDMRTGHAAPTDRGELNTRATSLEPGTSCPRWLEFLRSCFPNEPEMPAYLQRLVGYGLTAYGTEQAFILMHGTGANGKSTFVDALTHAFRQYVEHLPIQVLMASKAERSGEEAAPQLLKLRGARLVFTSESDREGRLNEAMIKQLTGTDQISARGLYKDPVTFQPQALIFMATNHLPQVRGTDDGIWRRVKVIEWAESFRGRENKDIFTQLQAEAAGIIDWALDGAVTWAQQGLAEPDRVKLATAAYRHDSDALTHFFAQDGSGEVQPDQAGFMSRDDLMQLWVEWNGQQGTVERDCWKATTLFKALRERGVVDVGRGKVRGFRLRRST